MNNVERRVSQGHPITVETRAVSGKEVRVLTGYASVFDVEADIGYFREIVRPGAFKRALDAGADVRALFNHDSSAILGRRSAKTMTVKEDSHGLWFEATLPDTQSARDLVVSIERGDVTGASFSFTVNPDGGQRWTFTEGDDKELRELLDVDPIDVSPVTFPAFDDTEIALRCRDKAHEVNWAKEARQMKRKLELASVEI